MIVTKVINVTLQPGSSINDVYINVPWKVTEIRTKQMTMNTGVVAGEPLSVSSDLIFNETHGLVWSKLDVTFSSPYTFYKFRAPQDIQGTYRFQLTKLDGTGFIPAAATQDRLSLILEFIGDEREKVA